MREEVAMDAERRQEKNSVKIRQRTAVALLLTTMFAASGRGAEERPLRVLLFDFEQGVEGWLGNPWGGGTCGAEASTEAKFGEGCLRGWYTAVEKGANVICPYFAADAAWREVPWGGISFYLRGDGSTGKLTLQLEADEETHATYSRSVPLEPTTWRRVFLPFSTFWNRGGKRFDPRRMRRFYFGTSGDHSFFVDQIQLESAHRVVPMATLVRGDGVPPEGGGLQWNDYGGGLYGALLDGSVLGEGGVFLRAVAELGGRRFAAEGALASGERFQRELFLPVTVAAEAEGEASIRLELADQKGQTRLRLSGTCPVFLPIVSVTPAASLPIVPTPKEVRPAAGHLALKAPLRLRLSGMAGSDDRPRRFLERELLRWYDLSLEQAAAGVRAEIVLHLQSPGAPAPADVPLPSDVARRLESVVPEGYVQHVSAAGAVLAARDAAGLYYAVQTFLQNVELATLSPIAPRASCGDVIDWPSLPRRALSQPLPTSRWGHPNDAPVDVDFFCNFIERFVARRKLNTLVLLIRQGVQFESHPEISGPAAWTKDELRQVVDTCRANFIEPIPLVDSYGHAAWMSLSHKELWEDGIHQMVCTSKPETFTILTDIYGELIDLFAPVRYFHLGLDEVWWKTYSVPEEKRCKLCAGTAKSTLFADQVNRLHGWLKERGIRAMMWSDVLLPEHNGGAPYHGAKALPLIPDDVLQTNWSTSLAGDSNRRLHDRGFAVWQSNSRGVNREQALYCEGNMFGVWSKMPWWSDAPWRSGGSYSYLNLPVAAQYSWNLWPDTDTLQPPLTWDGLRAFERGALERDGLEPEPRAGAQTFTLPVPGNLCSRAAEPAEAMHWFSATPEADLRHVPRGEVTVGGTLFRVADGNPDCAAPLPPGQGSVVVPVGRRAASLRFLHSAHVVPEQAEVLNEHFKKKQNWRGIPIGAYTIRYADGSETSCPILYVNNIRSWCVGKALPYVFRSVGHLFARTGGQSALGTDGRDDVVLCVAQWVNPAPQKTIEAIEMTGSSEAVPVLFAISGRDVRGR